MADKKQPFLHVPKREEFPLGPGLAEKARQKLKGRREQLEAAEAAALGESRNNKETQPSSPTGALRVGKISVRRKNK